MSRNLRAANTHIIIRSFWNSGFSPLGSGEPWWEVGQCSGKRRAPPPSASSRGWTIQQQMPARSFSARGWRRVVKKLLHLYLTHQYLWCYCYCAACTFFSLINLHPSFQKKKTGNSWQGSYVSCADNHVGRGGGEGREQWSGQCLPLTYVGKTMLSHTNFNITRVGTSKPAHAKHVCWAKHGVKAGGTVHPSLHRSRERERKSLGMEKRRGGDKRGVVCLDFWPLCWKMGNGCPTAESLSWCNRQDYFLPWLLFWPGL